MKQLSLHEVGLRQFFGHHIQNVTTKAASSLYTLKTPKAHGL